MPGKNCDEKTNERQKKITDGKKERTERREKSIYLAFLKTVLIGLRALCALRARPTATRSKTPMEIIQSGI